MAFPTTLDTLKDTWSGSEAPYGHANHHNNLAVLVYAIQAKLGINNSTDANSLDYKMRNHNHNSVYAVLTHNHDSAYAAIGHNHDSAYAAIGHTHDMTPYALTTHTHTQYNIVKNGTYTGIAVSGGAYSNDQYSAETGIIATPTVATVSLYSLNATAYLEKWNGSAWVALYTNSTYSTTVTFSFVLQEGIKYRCHTYAPGGGSVSASASLYYTV